MAAFEPIADGCAADEIGLANERMEARFKDYPRWVEAQGVSPF